jgi:leader peptidase (prepilin peptidase)/N-methyltransferase
VVIPLLLIFLFLCWGSFLNKGESLRGRSHCVHCRHLIAWYDNIPVISYFLLGGKCRTCHQSISSLYPFIELGTVLSMMALYYYADPEYFFAYFLFFSALIITIRTDLETMLISRLVTLPLVPIGFLLSCFDHISIIPLDSAMGAAIGYISLWLISAIFCAFTGKQGIGEGDYELLASIGAFTGIFGIWACLMISSILGSVIGIIYLAITGKLKRHAQLPFGPFLALGAILYILWEEHIAFLLTSAFN